MKDLLRKNKKGLVVILLLLILLGIVGLLSFVLPKKSATNIVDKADLTDYSSSLIDESSAQYNLITQEGYIFKTQAKGKDAAIEIIKSNFRLNENEYLLPDNFLSKSEITKSSVEKDENKREHYYFSQNIHGIPILGAFVSVHLKNGNEVYGLQGKVVKKEETTQEKISADDARRIALEEANKELPNEKKFIATILQRVIINKKILGVENDPVNYITTPIIVSVEDGTFSMTYYVELDNGKIIYRKTNILDALNRNVYSCKSGSCVPVRSEGAPAASDADANDMYDNLGGTYNFFNTFGRDSYDDSGSTLVGYAYYPSYTCPYANARWDGINRVMLFGPGLSKSDVVGHELAHGVTQYSAGLQYSAESGALNEAFSDIAGSALDNNWSIGDDVNLSCLTKPLRSMDNPPLIGQPDRLFATQYVCAGLPNSCAGGAPSSGGNDFCGVHTNSGVMNKAFYLMTDGGSFNGCSINGIGRTRSHAIVYQALTNYLHPTSNFKDAYSGILTACNDLYASDPGVCDQVKKALQATEMDQQPDGTQSGPKCTGATPQTPACAGGGSGPTVALTPFPTTSSGGGGGTSEGFKVSGKVYIDVNNNAVFDTGDTPYKDARLELTDGPKTGSVMTNTSGDYLFTDYATGLYTLTLYILGSKKESRPVVLGPDQTIDFRIFSSLTEPTIVAKPTAKVGPTIGFGPSLTPTPVPHICEFDPKCAAQKKNLQLCKLICRPKT